MLGPIGNEERETYDKLLSNMSDKQKELLDKYLRLYCERIFKMQCKRFEAGFQIGLAIALGCRIGGADAEAFCSGYGCYGGYLSAPAICGVAKVSVCGVYYAREAAYVHGYSLHIFAEVQFGIAPAYSGGVQHYIGATVEFYQVVEAFYSVIGGHVDAFAYNIVGI